MGFAGALDAAAIPSARSLLAHVLGYAPLVGASPVLAPTTRPAICPRSPGRVSTNWASRRCASASTSAMCIVIPVSQVAGGLQAPRDVLLCSPAGNCERVDIEDLVQQSACVAPASGAAETQ